MVSTLFRDRSSALAALGTPQPRAFGSLNRVETLDSASIYSPIYGDCRIYSIGKGRPAARSIATALLLCRVGLV